MQKNFHIKKNGFKGSNDVWQSESRVFSYLSYTFSYTKPLQNAISILFQDFRIKRQIPKRVIILDVLSWQCKNLSTRNKTRTKSAWAAADIFSNSFLKEILGDTQEHAISPILCLHTCQPQLRNSSLQQMLMEGLQEENKGNFLSSKMI